MHNVPREQPNDCQNVSTPCNLTVLFLHIKFGKTIIEIIYRYFANFVLFNIPLQKNSVI